MNWLILAETTAKKVNVSRRRWALFPVVLGVHGPEILIIFRPAEIRVIPSFRGTDVYITANYLIIYIS